MVSELPLQGRSVERPNPLAVGAAALRVFSPLPSPETTEAGRVAVSDSATGQVRQMIVRSRALLDLMEKASRVARSKVPVLFQGESGTGKELLARLIHESSPRRDKPLIQVNCASFSESLIESELFGHEKGAFTGAAERHRGHFERADEGSLLLDEIGEMPLKLQAKLLRVLEEETFVRVGGEHPLKVNVRLIATTNRDLEHEVTLGQFRRDLFFRLNAMPFHVPPLRTRIQEISPLVDYFIEQYSDQGEARVTTIAAPALARLLEYSWPGNVRQLRNVIHHACVLAHKSCIEAADLPILREPSAEPALAGNQRTLAEVERQRILETLREVGGNKTAAALRLGVTVRTLQNKLKRYREEAA